MSGAQSGDRRAMLEIRNLSVSIQDKLILDSLSLSVNAGEVAAIMGPNGSGKSTLAYVIAGKPGYEVTSGEIFLDGRQSPRPRAQRACAQAGYFWRSSTRPKFPASAR